MRASHVMPFGAALLPDGGAHFRLWAPADAAIELVLHREHGQVVIDSTTDAVGWREVFVAFAEPGERYHWRMRASLPTPTHGAISPTLMPDPASRSNPDGVHGASMLIDPQAFEWDDGWRGRPWTDAICYELHVGAFTPEGTFEAAQAHLPGLAELGITCIQLMPVASFPGRFGWGYDGVLPYAPHATYGPPESLKAFVQAAHRLGLMVMLDVVYNHFGPEGNYLSLYAPHFFTKRHHTPWGAAINFDGPDAGPVRAFFIHNALYWLEEYQLDGLRFDAVHAIVDDSPTDILQEISLRVRAHYKGSSRHIHLVLENDDNDASRLAVDAMPCRFNAQWNGDFHHALHVQLTGEQEGYYAEYANQPPALLSRALTHGFALAGAPHSAAQKTYPSPPRHLTREHVPLPCTLNFLQNHDQVGNRAFGERLTQLVPEEPLRLAVAILLLNPAPPLLFMGEEWGGTTPFLYFADWQGALHQAVSEGRRREFAGFAAFSDPASRARIPDPCDISTFERSRLDWQAFRHPRSQRWHRFYGDLIALRRHAIQPMLPALCKSSHEAEVTGNLMTVRWRFAALGHIQARDLTMQVNLGEAKTPLPQPGRQELSETLFELGTCAPDHLGLWSGRWGWTTTS